VVTGSAQGFGEGIAAELLRHGCYLVYADLNEALARRNAEAANQAYGEGAAIAVRCDVGDEDSVAALMDATVAAYGGLDLFVSNAGILISGGLEDMDLKRFELVTKVNYTAFFLCAKHAARVMRLQRRFNPACTADIVQVNSKSGLEGSNKNFAYAGGKFGGIGLTQSFAKELVEYGIKVNAVCPGNYLDGPLWTDPEKGLFVQYLRAGKVPGARDAQDVRRFYEAKVPMNRGCFPADVARAILYCVEQAYETGQAIPVTGGQNMLK
jgi:NAD(P)-dependent dehydrogenase (short-subunit alcohol dehydrogenase family)